MGIWRSTRARLVLAALLRIGWSRARQKGSHCTLKRPDWEDYHWSFHDRDEIGPPMLARIAKQTGLRPEDL
jgi:predicted RNA binding protein YcfA (HicA-like mRNA interferase family)